VDRIIEVKVNGNYLTKDNKNAGVRGEGNVTNLRITFDEGWDGFAKKVTFWDALGENPVERTLTADLLENITESTRVYIVPIPAEPMAEAGMLTFVIDGYIDGKRQRSIEDKLDVKDAPIADNAGEPTDPTPTQAEQLQTQIDTLLGDMQTERIAAQTASGEAKGYAQSAEEKALEAEGFMLNAKVLAENAKQSAGNALEYSEKAQEAVGKTNYIGDNGNWYAWDSEMGAFYDTGVKAQSGSTVYLGDNPPDEADVWIFDDGKAYTGADWNQTDETQVDYIKNKPDIYTKVETDAKLAQKVDKTDITNLYSFKGSVDTYEDLVIEKHIDLIPAGEPTLDGEVCGSFDEDTHTVTISPYGITYEMTDFTANGNMTLADGTVVAYYEDGLYNFSIDHNGDGENEGTKIINCLEIYVPIQEVTLKAGTYKSLEFEMFRKRYGSYSVSYTVEYFIDCNYRIKLNLDGIEGITQTDDGYIVSEDTVVNSLILWTTKEDVYAANRQAWFFTGGYINLTANIGRVSDYGTLPDGLTINIPIKEVALEPGYYYLESYSDMLAVINDNFVSYLCNDDDGKLSVFKIEEELVVNCIVYDTHGGEEDYKGESHSVVGHIIQIFDKCVSDEEVSSYDGYYFTTETSDIVFQKIYPTVGDAYNVTDTDMNYAWNGEAWDALGGKHIDQEARDGIFNLNEAVGELAVAKADVAYVDGRVNEESELLRNDIDNKANLNEVSNALKGSASGEVISLNDVSPVGHTLDIRVSNENIIPYPYYYFGNQPTKTISGITFTDNGDGSITINGTSEVFVPFYLTLYNGNINDLFEDGETYTMSKIPTGVAMTLAAYDNVNNEYSYYNKGNSKTTFTIDKSTYDYKWIQLQIEANVTIDNQTIYPKINKGTTAAEYTPYIEDLTGVKLTVSESGEVYTSNLDGTVDGVQSISPNMTLVTDAEGVAIDCKYNKDANKVIETLTNAIISLGGNV